MDNQKLLLERQERILRAMRNEKNDRVPLLFAGDCALIRYAKPKTNFAYMINSHEEMTKTIVEEVLPQFPKMDYLAAVGMSSKFLGAVHMAKTYLPGRELPENEMWQPVFEHIMTEEDYDDILDHGWKQFQEKCMFDRLGYDPVEMGLDFEAGMRNKKLYHDAGVPFMYGDMLPAPFDALAFGRGLMDFFVDMYEVPEKIIGCMDIIMDEWEADNRDKLRQTVADCASRGERVMCTVVPCVQANCNLLSREQFEQFGWPLLLRQANFVLEQGADVFFHMDTSWTKFLDLFTCFPKGRCLFDSDGGTDLEVLRDTLGDRMAITGCVSPALMAFGTPDAVYQECRREIEIMGDSFILAPSCTLPANMPKENIDAMYAAVE